MDISNHLRHLEQIERDIVDKKLDSLVMGLGASGWLVPWIDRKILLKLRLWGCHDICRIMPVDDLVIMDSPVKSQRLRYGTEAFKMILNSRPKRLWLYKNNAKTWHNHLHFSMASVTQEVDFFVWQRPKLRKGETRPKHFKLEWDRPQTGLVSPTGTASLAWREGHRRIGVIGVDMGPDHQTHGWITPVDDMFTRMAAQSHELGGTICNLSPISHLRRFREWTPSTSTSEPTDGSEKAEPKTSSNTASESTVEETSKSTG